MASITISVSCEKCPEYYEKEFIRDATNRFTKTDFINSASQEGWQIGLVALCPKCKNTIKNICRNCLCYENKSMCQPICTRHNLCVLEGDFCDKWEPKEVRK